MLFLSGGGSGKDSEGIDRLFIDSIDSSKSVIYVPIAIDKKIHPYPECLEWIKNNFKPYDYENFTMWTEEELNKIAKNANPSDYGGIYIGGGNAHYLLHQIKQSPFMNFLIEANKSRIPIAGGSAGAMVLGKTTSPAFIKYTDLLNNADFDGLNFINDYTIWPHYNSQSAKNIFYYSEQYNMPKLIGIPEDTALTFEDNTLRVVGHSPVTILANSHLTIINPGDNFKD